MPTLDPTAYRRQRGRPAVAIGNFDGVHIGHQEIFRRTCHEAVRLDGDAVALTFSPHPTKVVSADPPLLLQSEADKLSCIADSGIEVTVVQRFDPALAALWPEEFVRRILVESLQARAVLVGRDFCFGRGRSGTVRTLRELGRRLDFRVGLVEPVKLDGEAVSSSRVRRCVREGRLEEARRLLGRPHSLSGRVVTGVGRGRQIGVPTANVAAETELLPGHGVYAGRVRLPAGTALHAVINVGTAPTFGDRETVIEAHLLDFDGDLVGLRLEVSFLRRLRDERRFSGVDALVAQIRTDIARAKDVLAA